MKCPNDQTEMEKGTLYSHGQGWMLNQTDFLGRLFYQPWGVNSRVYAWKCPKCGKIELYTEEKK